jgi:hypothetical protein
MELSNYTSDPMWTLVMGLLIAGVLGATGVGLLLWALWHWLVERAHQFRVRPQT